MSSIVSRRRRRLRLVGVGVVLVLGVLLGIGGSAAVAKQWGIPDFLASEHNRRDDAAVRALTRTEQISLISAGVQGIVTEENKTRFFGMPVLFTDRVKFIQYGYTAKLGVDGSKVSIEKVGEKRYKLSIPEYMFIGHDEVTLKTAVEKDGVLSFITPEIDTAAMVESILNDESRQQLVRDNRQLLEDQTKSFYTGILNATEPGAAIEFVLPQQ